MIDQHSPDLETALGRGVLYTFLSTALAYPTPETRTELDEGILPFVLALETGDTETDRLIHEVAGHLTAPLADLRRAHGRVFTPIEPEDYPSYETAYDPADIFRQTSVMADVAAFYRAHGLQVGGAQRERPDHVATELEFLGFMARKEAYALAHLGPDEIEECRRTQVHFLRDHLGCWGPAFGRRLAASAPEPLYATAGRLLALWLGAELAAWAVEPARNLDEPQPHPPPEGDECDFADECGVAAGMPADIGTEP